MKITIEIEDEERFYHDLIVASGPEALIMIHEFKDCDDSVLDFVFKDESAKIWRGAINYLNRKDRKYNSFIEKTMMKGLSDFMMEYGVHKNVKEIIKEDL